MKKNSEKKFTDKEIDAFVVEMMKDDPVRFLQYALVVIGKEIYKANAETFTLKQESDLANGKRFEISVKGKIKLINKP